jgi:AcrR family transcriptional regulator
MTKPGTRLSGRRAEAARNDQRILDAALAVFIEDAGAPIARVAERAGVGIGALYRRFPSKEDLLQHLGVEGLRSYIAAVERALEDPGDPWDAFTRFMERGLEAETSVLTVRFAGHYAPTPELHRLRRAAYNVTEALVTRTQAAGALRADIGPGDIPLLFEQLQGIRGRNQAETLALRRRHLRLLLDALHLTTAPPLPGAAPTEEELSARYTPRRRSWEIEGGK